MRCVSQNAKMKTSAARNNPSSAVMQRSTWFGVDMDASVARSWFVSFSGLRQKDPANPGTQITVADPSTSIGYVTIRQQVGIGAGMTFHIADNFHFTLEYFRAVFQWYKPTPAAPGTDYPQQVLNAINGGVTYDF